MEATATPGAALAAHVAHLGPFTASDELARLGIHAQPGLPPTCAEHGPVRDVLAGQLAALACELPVCHLIVAGPELVTLEAIAAAVGGVTTTVWLAVGTDSTVRDSVSANLPHSLDGDVVVAPGLPRLRRRGVVALVVVGLYAGFMTRVPLATKSILDHMHGCGLRAEIVLLDPVGAGGQVQPPGFGSVYTARAFTRTLIHDS